MSTYFYLHPFKPQYFFPKGFKKYAPFHSFFKPYSLFGRISWFLFKHLSVYRILFKKQGIGEFIPETKIKTIIGADKTIAFNRGTVGPEQKITALVYDGGNYFFIKYGESDLARRNISNEHEVLREIQAQLNVPRVMNFYSDHKVTLLKTTLLEGKRIGKRAMDSKILDYLIKISGLKIDLVRSESFTLKSCFAHGDFCPWNMMDKNGDILVYDWEMAGYKPLGYDLFTFIFQPLFLLHTKQPVSYGVEHNKQYINAYFLRFNIKDWRSYLQSFAHLKVEQQKVKNDQSQLTHKFELLKQYAQKA